MAESKQAGNGADDESRRQGRGGGQQSLVEVGRQLQGDAQTMVTHVQEASSEIQTYLTQRVRERPVSTLAAAAGIGYLLGGGLSSRLTLLMAGLATRVGLAVAAREMGSWVAEGQTQGAVAGGGRGGGTTPTPTHH